MKLQPSHSLRTRLLWFLLAAIAATAVAQALIAYETARAETDEIFDYQMQQMARSLRSGLPTSERELLPDESHEEEHFDFAVQVWTLDGALVFQSAEAAALPQHGVPGFSELGAKGATYRVFAMRSRSHIVQVSQDMSARREMASALALRTVAPVALMAPVLMLVVWWVVRTSLAPMTRVRRQVAERQVDDLTEVSEDGLPDEIRPLIHELNMLFKRVRQAFDVQNDFVADAAHELRSPLAALKLQVLGLQRANDGAARDVAVSRLNAGIDRATRLVEQLLVLARQQANAATGSKPEAASLADLARLAVADIAVLAQARQIDLGMDESEQGQISGRPEALRILMRNLLDNAIKYTPVGGTIDVKVIRDRDDLLLTVEDSGVGIPEPDRERVLDRFYRVAGTQGTGSGLGLAIVKSIADLHGATLSLSDGARRGGLRVELRFPLQR